jgi:hypothetical protein
VDMRCAALDIGNSAVSATTQQSRMAFDAMRVTIMA